MSLELFYNLAILSFIALPTLHELLNFLLTHFDEGNKASDDESEVLGETPQPCRLICDQYKQPKSRLPKGQNVWVED